MAKDAARDPEVPKKVEEGPGRDVPFSPRS
jgi:hypothetical protein